MEGILHQNPKSTAFAEITESSLKAFTACSWKWENTPPFGSIIKSQQQDRIIYAIIYDVKTTSLDPMREIHMYQKTEEEMRKEYPHLFDFLKTNFQALIIGYQENNQYRYRYPKTPTKLYSFIEYAHTEELHSFFSDTGSMKLLFNPGLILDQYEDLIYSIIETQKKLKILSQDQLATIMTQYALATGSSYRQLKTFFDRIL